MADGILSSGAAETRILARLTPEQAKTGAVQLLLARFNCTLSPSVDGTMVLLHVDHPQVFEIEKDVGRERVFKVFWWKSLPGDLRVVVLSAPHSEDTVRLANQPKLAFIATTLGVSPKEVSQLETFPR
jgi:hypothetical protein